MLVLAGMVSLSIIGSIASIPSGSIEGRIGIDQPQSLPAEPQPAPSPDRAAPAATENSGMAAPEAAVAGGTALAPVPPKEPGAEDWLEAITYALLALVGLGALATLILWRNLAHRRRIADALELLAARG